MASCRGGLETAAEAAPSILRSKILKWAGFARPFAWNGRVPAVASQKLRRDADTAIAVSFGLPHDQLV